MSHIMVNRSLSFPRRREPIFASAILSCLLCSTASFALPTDQNQVVNVRAGSADINQQTHQGIYKDHVQLEQGTTHIESNQATTTGNDKNQLISAMITGTQDQQAHYSTMTEIDKPPLHAYADIIKYYPQRHLIELIGHARVEQGKNVFSAAKISFNTQTHHVVSQSDGKQRTTIIFYPETHT